MHPEPTAERMHPHVWPGAHPAHNCLFRFFELLSF
jgi:hypothetical protein